MGFKRIDYQGEEEIVKIKVIGVGGGKSENWTIMMSDLAKYVRKMAQKYNIDGMKKDKDLDWAI